VEDRIELRIAPALETLESLPGDEPFDFAFIDADKVNYPSYWERVVPLLRPGGLVAVDNVLYSGAVVDEDGGGESRESLEAIRRTNEMIVADERVTDVVMLGIADGITLAVKR
jgi:caffeoyl-CoA O-methyltransferase